MLSLLFMTARQIWYYFPQLFDGTRCKKRVCCALRGFLYHFGLFMLLWASTFPLAVVLICKGLTHLLSFSYLCSFLSFLYLKYANQLALFLSALAFLRYASLKASYTWSFDVDGILSFFDLFEPVLDFAAVPVCDINQFMWQQMVCVGTNLCI